MQCCAHSRAHGAGPSGGKADHGLGLTTLLQPFSMAFPQPCALQAFALCEKLSAGGASCDQIAKALAEGAVKAGSTDDVSIIVLKLK